MAESPRRVAVADFLVRATLVCAALLVIAVFARSRPALGALGVMTLAVSVPAAILHLVAAVAPERWFSVPAEAEPKLLARVRRLCVRDAIFSLVCTIFSAVACAYAL